MEAAMEKKNMEIQAINHQTIGQRLKSYKRSPLSLVLFTSGIGIRTSDSADTAVFDRVYSDQGNPYLTPSLFAWEYTTENVSLMPALINTVVMTGLSLLIAVPSRHFRSHLPGRICEARQPAREHRADYR